jgi:hypothetical protein
VEIFLYGTENIDYTGLCNCYSLIVEENSFDGKFALGATAQCPMANAQEAFDGDIAEKKSS